RRMPEQVGVAHDPERQRRGVQATQQGWIVRILHADEPAPGSGIEPALALQQVLATAAGAQCALLGGVQAGGTPGGASGAKRRAGTAVVLQQSAAGGAATACGQQA